MFPCLDHKVLKNKRCLSERCLFINLRFSFPHCPCGPERSGCLAGFYLASDPIEGNQMLIPFLASWGFTFLLYKSLLLSQQGSACVCPESVEFSTVWEPGPDSYSVPSFFPECKCSALAWTRCGDGCIFTRMCFSKCVAFSLHNERDFEPHPECPQPVGFIIRFLTCRL